MGKLGHDQEEDEKGRRKCWNGSGRLVGTGR